MKVICLAAAMAVAVHASAWHDVVRTALQLEQENRSAAALDLLRHEAARLRAAGPAAAEPLAQVLRVQATIEFHDHAFQQAEETLFEAWRAIPPDTAEAEALQVLVKSTFVALYLARGQLGLAESAAAWLDQASAGSENISTADSTELLTRLGLLRREQRRYRDAEELFRRALRQSAALPPPTAAEMQLCLRNNLACLYIDRGLSAPATAMLLEALAQAEQTIGSANPALIRVLQNLAAGQLRQGDAPAALPYAERSHHIAVDAYGPDDPVIAETARTLALVYRSLRRKREARALEADARRIENGLPADPLAGSVVDIRSLSKP